MTHRALIVAVGAVLWGAVSAGAVQATTLSAGPPVAIPPGTPTTTSVVGAPLNGVQLSVVSPKQLPMDLSQAAVRLAPREIDITVKDVGGAGYTGMIATSFTEESAGGASGFTASVERFDATSSAWTKVNTPSGGQTSFEDDTSVTVPAGGVSVVKYRAGAGVNVFDDLKVFVTSNGASVTAVLPVTRPKVDVTGMPGSVHAGVPYPLTVTVTNPTDVDYESADVEFEVQACDVSGTGCFLAKDSKLEMLSAGPWMPLAVQDGQQQSGFSAFLVRNGSLLPGTKWSMALRITLPINNLQVVNPMHFVVAPNFASQITGGMTLIAAPVPSPATRTPQAASPTTQLSGTPVASSALPSTTTSTPPSDASPSASDSATATDISSASPSQPLSAMPAATSSSDAGTNVTILLAFGLLVLCGGLVGGYFYLKRRGQV